MKTILFVLAVFIFSCTVVANTAMYSQVASQYPENALSKQQISNAAMQGKCLVQIKELTLKRKMTLTLFQNGSITARYRC